METWRPRRAWHRQGRWAPAPSLSLGYSVLALCQRYRPLALSHLWVGPWDLWGPRRHLWALCLGRRQPCSRLQGHRLLEHPKCPTWALVQRTPALLQGSLGPWSALVRLPSPARRQVCRRQGPQALAPASLELTLAHRGRSSCLHRLVARPRRVPGDPTRCLDPHRPGDPTRCLDHRWPILGGRCQQRSWGDQAARHRMFRQVSRLGLLLQGRRCLE